jgi:hypothetical protein
LFFAPLLFGSDIYPQQVTTFSTLAGVAIQEFQVHILHIPILQDFPRFREYHHDPLAEDMQKTGKEDAFTEGKKRMQVRTEN